MHIFWNGVDHELTEIQWQITRQITSDLNDCRTRPGHHDPPAARTTLLLQAEQHLHEAQLLLTRARRNQ